MEGWGERSVWSICLLFRYFQKAKMDRLVKSKSRARQGLYRCPTLAKLVKAVRDGVRIR